MRRVTRRKGWNTGEPIAMTARVPMSAIGRSGACAFTAIYAPPSLNGWSNPSADRPPSGKISIEIERSRITAAALVIVFDRRSRIFTGHRNMTRLRQVRSQKRNLKQALFSQETEIRGNAAEDRGRIHITQVIRADDIASFRVNLLQTLDGDAHPCNPQQRPSPYPPHANRGIAAFVEQREEDADAAAQERGQNDERVDYDQAPEKGHEFLL